MFAQNNKVKWFFVLPAIAILIALALLVALPRQGERESRGVSDTNPNTIVQRDADANNIDLTPIGGGKGQEGANNDAKNQGLTPVPVYYTPKSIAAPEGADPTLKPLIEAWRLAVLRKQPRQIEQTVNEIVGCGSRAIPWLLQMYREDESEKVRAHTVRMLGRLRNRELIDFFVAVLQKDKSEDARLNAVWSIETLEHPGAIRDLQQSAENDASQKVRDAAKVAAGKLH